MLCIKQLLSKILPSSLWRYLRELKIVREHREVASFCEKLIDEYYSSDFAYGDFPIVKMQELDTDKIIWQFWAQGYDNAPETVKECMDSVEQWSGDYKVIRLSIENYGNFIQFPVFFQKKVKSMSLTHFSDNLRLCLLSQYGGVWLDATVKMTGFIPERYSEMDYFVYQRDPSEPNKSYWKNTYAYYFGWHKDFRVNMLSSIMIAKRDSKVIHDVTGMMLYYWRNNHYLVHYFLLQVLYDVLIQDKLKYYKCPVESDCKPHYLQQYINDPKFSLATECEIISMIPFHKLTYKK